MTASIVVLQALEAVSRYFHCACFTDVGRGRSLKHHHQGSQLDSTPDHFTAQWPLSGMGETGPHKGSGHVAWLDTTLFWAERLRLQLSE